MNDMDMVKLRTGRVLADYNDPYIVAEVNSSHNGRVEVARQMIDAAVAAGCDCVKFQSWSAESLYSSSYYKDNPISKRFFTKFSLSPGDLKGLAAYCREKGVDYCSTPYSREEVDFLLDECGAPYVKIASMDSNNLAFLRYISRKGAPIVLSTGMSTLEEVRRAVETIVDAGNQQLCLLHCISVYPADFESIRLNNILGLREAFPGIPIGFSDHSLGIEMAVAATALGAALIEKHLTLDRSKIGMDNQMATEPDEMKQLVTSCHNTHMALGGRERIVSESEREQMKKMRRSIIAARDLPSGTVLTENDLDAKRPGVGIPADQLDNLLGKTLKQAVRVDSLLRPEDIEL